MNVTKYVDIEFWTNRLAATDPPLETTQTRVPEIPDQTEFIARWFEFHQGYRVAKMPNGTEQRIAVIGEPLKEVSPGFLPRTLAQLRAGVENDARRPENRLTRMPLLPEETHSEAAQPSLESALDSLMDEVSIDEAPAAADEVTPLLVQTPLQTQQPRPMNRGEARLERARERFTRMFGTREDIQHVDYESPLSSLYNRADDRYRQAEERRATNTTEPPAVDGLSAQERRDIEEQLLWGVMRESATHRQLEQEGDVWSYAPRPRRFESGPFVQGQSPQPQPLPVSDADLAQWLTVHRPAERVEYYYGDGEVVDAQFRERLENLDPATPTTTTDLPSNTETLPSYQERLRLLEAQNRARIFVPVTPTTSADLPSSTEMSPSIQEQLRLLEAQNRARLRAFRREAELRGDPDPFSSTPRNLAPPTTNLSQARQHIENMNVLRLQQLRQAAEAMNGTGRSMNPRFAHPVPPVQSLDNQPDRPAPMADEDMTRTLACQVCYQQLADIACLPCGHMVMCQWCADVVIPVKHGHLPVNMTKCPMCRKQVKQRFKIHMG